MHGADSLLNLVLGVVFVRLSLAVHEAGPLGLRKILVAPSMRTYRMPGSCHLLKDLGVIGGMQADGEEKRLGAVGGERREHRGGIFRPRPVVEREHRLAFPQEIVCLKLLKAETGATCRVDLDDAGDAECIGVGRAREGSARRM